jgi:hypothetical protein
MSLSMDGRKIMCDGQDCPAVAWLPVGLTTLLPRHVGPDARSVAGWLFVTRRDEALHYCPCCVPIYLRTITASSGAPTDGAI